jgi:hypothetical protein
MVNFKLASPSDPRLTADIRSRFLRVGQLVAWDLTDSSGQIYTGLVIVGEKPHPQGFQSVADITVDIPEGDGIPIDKIQELSRIVQTELVQRTVVTYKK